MKIGFYPILNTISIFFFTIIMSFYFIFKSLSVWCIFYKIHSKHVEGKHLTNTWSHRFVSQPPENRWYPWTRYGKN